LFAQNLAHFRALGFRYFLNFGFLALKLGAVVFEIRARGKIAAEPHGESACRDLGETRGNDDGCRGNRPCKTRREGERNGQPIRHPNDNIADEG
jgi:hypothetical protein